MSASLWYLKNYPYEMLIAPQEDPGRWKILSPGETWNGTDGQEQALILMEGQLCIRRPSPSRGMVTVEVLNRGEIVGTLAASEQPEYLEEVVAMEECVWYVLDRREIDHRISTWALPAITFLRLEGWRLRRYATHPRDLVFRTLPMRLASTLLMLAHQYPGAGKEDEQTLACLPQPRHLADLTGSSVERIQHVLEEWQLRGRLSQTQGRLTLKNIAGFYDLVRSADTTAVESAA
ncbi:MAG: hypothetical protein JWL77_6428 [Chthonomonadaceae bacterium]|nr:hypothetical protein [Chthonomonadaceae bacterium]